MRKALLVALAIVMCGFYAVAQDYPKAELFGGFSLAHLDTENVQSILPAGTNVKEWYPGWEFAGQYNFTKLLGVKADISGNYGQPVSFPGVTGFPSGRAYTFLFGPVVSFRGDRITPFVHAGFGGSHISSDASTVKAAAVPAISDTAFAFALGGGVDWKLTHHFSWRLGQFDYVYTKHDGCAIFAAAEGVAIPAGCESKFPDHQNNFHFSTGIVIH